jgi:hypothetical protein
VLTQFPGFGQNIARLFDIFTQKTPVTKRQMATITKAAGDIGTSIGRAFGYAVGHAERLTGALQGIAVTLKEIDSTFVVRSIKAMARGVENIANVGKTVAYAQNVSDTNDIVTKGGGKVIDPYGGMLEQIGGGILSGIGNFIESEEAVTNNRMKLLNEKRANELVGEDRELYKRIVIAAQPQVEPVVKMIDRVQPQPISPVGGVMDATQPQQTIQPEPVQLAPQNVIPTAEEEKSEELLRVTKQALKESQEANRVRAEWKEQQNQRENDKARKSEIDSMLNTGNRNYSPIGG